MSDEQYRRESDRRLDNIEKMLTKIHTVLIGNGVPGLVQRHEDLVQQQKTDKRNVHERIDKVDDTVKKYVYGLGGIVSISIIIGLFNALKGLGVL